MTEIRKETKLHVQPESLQLMTAILRTIQSWAEKRLLAYHTSFPEGADGAMEALLAITVSATEVLQQDVPQEHLHRRKPVADVASGQIEVYIRSSMRTVFAQVHQVSTLYYKSL
jgi:hypothetical protein